MQCDRPRGMGKRGDRPAHGDVRVDTGTGRRVYQPRSTTDTPTRPAGEGPGPAAPSRLQEGLAPLGEAGGAERSEGSTDCCLGHPS